jgi:hypothetical protein
MYVLYAAYVSGLKQYCNLVRIYLRTSNVLGGRGRRFRYAHRVGLLDISEQTALPKELRLFPEHIFH